MMLRQQELRGSQPLPGRGLQEPEDFRRGAARRARMITVERGQVVLRRGLTALGQGLPGLQGRHMIALPPGLLGRLPVRMHHTGQQARTEDSMAPPGMWGDGLPTFPCMWCVF
jgi:hypothetical protein